MISAGRGAEVDGYLGYMEPYATSHQALDQDEAFQQEIINAARALGNAVRLQSAGKLEDPEQGLVEPNPKLHPQGWPEPYAHCWPTDPNQLDIEAQAADEQIKARPCRSGNCSFVMARLRKQRSSHQSRSRR
jgi:hypothetical protein